MGLSIINGNYINLALEDWGFQLHAYLHFFMIYLFVINMHSLPLFYSLVQAIDVLEMEDFSCCYGEFGRDSPTS